MRANLALFRSEFDDLQVSTFDGGLSFVVGNAAQPVSQGLEMDASWQATPAWRVDVSVARLDSAYADFRTASCWFGQTAAQGCVGGVQDLSGDATQFAPEWSGRAGLSYERPVGALRLAATLSANFASRYFIPNDNDPNVMQAGHAKLDARIGVGPAGERWGVAIIGRNLTNRLTTHWGNDLPLFNGSYFKFVDRPRTLEIQGTWRFE